MPEYLFKRNASYLNINKVNSIQIPFGFYSVFGLRDKLINTLNQNIYSFGDPGVATDITDYIDPDENDKDSMNYKKLLTFSEKKNKFNLCSFNITNHSIDNKVINIFPPTGEAIPCKATSRSKYVIIEYSDCNTTSSSHCCKYVNINNTNKTCSAKYYNLDNNYIFSHDSTNEYMISPSDPTLFKDKDGEKLAKGLNIKFFSETQFVYKKLIVNDSGNNNQNSSNIIYNPCVYLDFNYYIPYVYDDRLGFFYEAIHKILSVKDDDDDDYNNTLNGFVLPIQNCNNSVKFSMDVNVETHRSKIIQRLEEIDIEAIQVLIDYKDDPFFQYIQFMEASSIKSEFKYPDKTTVPFFTNNVNNTIYNSSFNMKSYIKIEDKNNIPYYNYYRFGNVLVTHQDSADNVYSQNFWGMTGRKYKDNSVSDDENYFIPVLADDNNKIPNPYDYIDNRCLYITIKLDHFLPLLFGRGYFSGKNDLGIHIFIKGEDNIMSQFSNGIACDSRLPHFSWFPIIFTNLPEIDGLSTDSLNYVSFFHISHVQSPEIIRKMADEIPVYAPCHILKIPKIKCKGGANCCEYNVSNDASNDASNDTGCDREQIEYEYFYRFRLYPKSNKNETKTSHVHTKSKNIIVSDSLFNLINSNNDNYKGSVFKIDKINTAKIPKLGRANIFKIESSPHSNSDLSEGDKTVQNIDCYSNNIMELFGWSPINNGIIVSKNCGYNYIHDNLYYYIENINNVVSSISNSNINISNYYLPFKLMNIIIENNEYIFDINNYIYMKIFIEGKAPDTLANNVIMSVNKNKHNDSFKYVGHISNSYNSSKPLILSNDTNNLFAKINFENGYYNNRCSIHTTPKVYYDKPLNDLDMITIQFVDYYGRLIDIRGEHNFTLEITEVKNILKDTLLDTNTNEVIITGYKNIM